MRLEALLGIGCSILPFCYIAEMGDFWRRGMGLRELVLGALRKESSTSSHSVSLFYVVTAQLFVFSVEKTGSQWHLH